MQIISIINQKGGVGKTTTVINLAAGLSYQGKKILVIDLDPQGNATTGLGLSNLESSTETIYGVLNGTKSIFEVIKKTKFSNLDIIKSFDGDGVSLFTFSGSTTSNRIFCIRGPNSIDENNWTNKSKLKSKTKYKRDPFNYVW